MVKPSPHGLLDLSIGRSGWAGKTGNPLPGARAGRVETPSGGEQQFGDCLAGHGQLSPQVL